MNLGQLIAKGFISNVHVCGKIQNSYSHDFIYNQNKGKKIKLENPQSKPSGRNKITIVGAGNLGIACAFALISRNISHELCVIDANESKAKGECMDLAHGSTRNLNQNLYIEATTEYTASANSKICIITAGVRQHKNQSQLEVTMENVEIIKEIIPQLIHHSPEAVILIATNPVDILTQVAVNISQLPYGRVIGTGTNLDSCRFRLKVAKKFGVPVDNCYGWIIGENGDSSVPLWSTVYIGRKKLTDLKPLAGRPDDPENWNEVHEKVISDSNFIISKKGYISWGTAMSVASITKAILNGDETPNAVSLPIKGYYNIREDVSLSLPVILGKKGVKEVIVYPITSYEKENLHSSAKFIAHAQKKYIDYWECMSSGFKK